MTYKTSSIQFNINNDDDDDDNYNNNINNNTIMVTLHKYVLFSLILNVVFPFSIFCLFIFI